MPPLWTSLGKILDPPLTSKIQTLWNSQCAIQFLGIYDFYISYFLYRIGDLRSCQFHDLPIRYKSMVKNEVPLMRIRSAQLTQNHNQIGYVCLISPASCCIISPFRPSEVTLWRHQVAKVLSIIFDRNELETWGWCHSVHLVNAHRLTCNITYFGHTISHTVALTWRDLRSNFKIDLSRIKTYGSIRLDEGNTMVSKLFP